MTCVCLLFRIPIVLLLLFVLLEVHDGPNSRLRWPEHWVCQGCKGSTLKICYKPGMMLVHQFEEQRVVLEEDAGD